MNGRLLQMSGIVADLLYDVKQVPAAGKEAIVSGFQIAPRWRLQRDGRRETRGHVRQLWRVDQDRAFCERRA